MMNPKEVEAAIADAHRFIDLATEYVKVFYSYEHAAHEAEKKYPEEPWMHCPIDNRSVKSGLVRAQSIVLWRQLAEMRKS